MFFSRYVTSENEGAILHSHKSYSYAQEGIFLYVLNVRGLILHSMFPPFWVNTNMHLLYTCKYITQEQNILQLF